MRFMVAPFTSPLMSPPHASLLSEAAPQGEVQVYPLHQPLCLHTQQRGARGEKGEALLLHRAQVADTDAVAHVRELERARVLRDRLRKDGLTILEREAARERVLDLAEGACADPAVFGERLLLLGGADLDLRLELAAEIERRSERGARAPHRVVTVLEHEEVARDAGHRSGERDARQARRLRFLDTVESGRDAPLGRD